MSVFDLADQLRIAGVGGPAPHPYRDPIAGHGHADHDLRQIGPVVLALAVGAPPDRLALVAAVLAGAVAVGAGVGGFDPATRVAGHGFVGLVEFEIGRCRVSLNRLIMVGGAGCDTPMGRGFLR
jgi:hypothetical protein